ncbi:MAG TPA: VanZ family protein [Anaerolineales bacterium]|nr:VanZ family protein [Anaerolineales bacterium]
MFRPSNLLRWLPAVMMMLAIFTLSSLPNDLLPYFGRYDILVKKTAHAIGYAMLAAAYFHALPSRLSPIYRGLLSFLMAVLFAMSDEFHQSFVRGRHPALRDVGIDSFGAAVALMVAMISAAIYSSNSSSSSVS